MQSIPAVPYSERHPDPAWRGRVTLTLLACIVLWPMAVFSEFKPFTLFDGESLAATGRFLAAFVPPAHDAEFLAMLLRETWQTIAIATAGLTLALLVDEPLSALDPALSQLTLTTLQQEAAARNAALVCSLHQVELALAHFPRIVALKEGKVAFDLPREQVTQAMVDELYLNEKPPANTPPEHDLATPLAVGGCL